MTFVMYCKRLTAELVVIHFQDSLSPAWEIFNVAVNDARNHLIQDLRQCSEHANVYQPRYIFNNLTKFVPEGN